MGDDLRCGYPVYFEKPVKDSPFNRGQVDLGFDQQNLCTNGVVSTGKTCTFRGSAGEFSEFYDASETEPLVL